MSKGSPKHPRAKSSKSSTTQRISAGAAPKQHIKQPWAFQARATPKISTPGYATPERVARHRKWALIGASVFAGFIAFRVAAVVAGYKRDADHYASLDPPIPLDVTDRWRNPTWAENFDLDVDTMEWLGGTLRLREKLCALARGHVLEASVGTGRNTTYYPLTKDIKTVTMVDTSPQMLEIARMKWAKNNAWFINAVFWEKSAGDKIPLPTPEAREQGGFDTVVQTMGVCSTPEPEKVLANFGRLCRQDGESRILLLEHGRSYYNWLNRWIDAIAPAHADREGCWFNKDIGEVVRRSGLEIIEEKRFHFGTVWWYVLKPPSVPLEKEKQTNTANENAQPVRSWSSFLTWK